MLLSFVELYAVSIDAAGVWQCLGLSSGPGLGSGGREGGEGGLGACSVLPPPRLKGNDKRVALAGVKLPRLVCVWRGGEGRGGGLPLICYLNR